MWLQAQDSLVSTVGTVPSGIGQFLVLLPGTIVPGFPIPPLRS
jgi:hypothetical protein